MESSDIPGERKEQQAIASSENVDSVGSSISNSFNGAKVSTDVATFPVKGEAKKDEIFGKFVSEKDTSFEKVKEAITSKPTAKGKRRKQGDNVTNIEDIFLKVEKEGAVTPPTMEKAEPAQISKKEKEAGPKVMEKSDSDAIVEKAAITSSKTIEKSHPVTIAEKEGTIGLRAMKKLAPATIEEKEVVTSSKTIEESDPVSIVEKKVVTNSKMMEKSYPVAILGTKGGTSLETVKKHDLIAMEENEAAPISKTTSKPSPSATVAKVETTILKTLEEPGPAKTVENGWASGAKMMNEPEPGPIVESEGTTSSQMVENSDLAAIESTCASIKKTEPQKPDDATKVKSTAIADTAAGTVSIGKVSNSTSLNFLEHAPTAEVSDRDAIITAAAKKRQLSDCAKKEKDQEEEKESRGDSSPFPKAGTALMPKKLVIAYKSVKPKRVPVVRKMMAAKSVGQKRPTAITEPALSDNNTSEEAETKTSPATDEPKQSCVPKDAPQDPTSPSFSTKPTTTATTSTINTSVLPTLYRPRIHASKNVISGPTFRSASVLSTDGLKRRKRAAVKSIIGGLPQPQYDKPDDDDDGNVEIVEPPKKKSARAVKKPPAVAQKTPINVKSKAPAKKSQQAKNPKPTKKPPKAPATEVSCGPPDEPIEGGWPDGWIKRTFERQSGATKGSRDRYWYTPITQKKLRSMVEVKRFMTALQEGGGDEGYAWKKLKGKL